MISEIQLHMQCSKSRFLLHNTHDENLIKITIGNTKSDTNLQVEMDDEFIMHVLDAFTDLPHEEDDIFLR